MLPPPAAPTAAQQLQEDQRAALRSLCALLAAMSFHVPIAGTLALTLLVWVVAPAELNAAPSPLEQGQRRRHWQQQQHEQQHEQQHDVRVLSAAPPRGGSEELPLPLLEADGDNAVAAGPASVVGEIAPASPVGTRPTAPASSSSLLLPPPPLSPKLHDGPFSPPCGSGGGADGGGKCPAVESAELQWRRMQVEQFAWHERQWRRRSTHASERDDDGGGGDGDARPQQEQQQCVEEQLLEQEQQQEASDHHHQQQDYKLEPENQQDSKQQQPGGHDATDEEEQQERDQRAASPAPAAGSQGGSLPAVERPCEPAKRRARTDPVEQLPVSKGARQPVDDGDESAGADAVAAVEAATALPASSGASERGIGSSVSDSLDGSRRGSSSSGGTSKSVGEADATVAGALPPVLRPPAALANRLRVERCSGDSKTEPAAARAPASFDKQEDGSNNEEAAGSPAATTAAAATPTAAATPAALLTSFSPRVMAYVASPSASFKQQQQPAEDVAYSEWSRRSSCDEAYAAATPPPGAPPMHTPPPPAPLPLAPRRLSDANNSPVWAGAADPAVAGYLSPRVLRHVTGASMDESCVDGGGGHAIGGSPLLADDADSGRRTPPPPPPRDLPLGGLPSCMPRAPSRLSRRASADAPALGVGSAAGVGRTLSAGDAERGAASEAEGAAINGGGAKHAAALGARPGESGWPPPKQPHPHPQPLPLPPSWQAPRGPSVDGSGDVYCWRGGGANDGGDDTGDDGGRHGRGRACTDSGALSTAARARLRPRGLASAGGGRGRGALGASGADALPPPLPSPLESPLARRLMDRDEETGRPRALERLNALLEGAAARPPGGRAA